MKNIKILLLCLCFVLVPSLEPKVITMLVMFSVEDFDLTTIWFPP